MMHKIIIFYESTEKNSNDEMEENDENERNATNDIKETFDTIQNHIVKDKYFETVKYLQNKFIQSDFAKEMKNLSEKTKKEAPLLFVNKIFMNSHPKEDHEEKGKNGSAKGKFKKTLTIDREELEQLDKIIAKKKDVDYLQVIKMHGRTYII